MSVHDVARRLGVHPTSVLRWERRERLPAPAHIHGLATVLALDAGSVAAFFHDARPAPGEPAGVRGHGLRAVRVSAGRTVRELASAVGVPVHTFYNWEHGRVRIPTTALPALADHLGLDPAALAGGLRAAPAVPPSPLRISPLRRLRWRTGLSQAAVARRIGFSRDSLGSWERGAQPPLSAVRRLAVVYGVRAEVVARAVRMQPPALLDRRRWRPGTVHEVLTVLRQWRGLTQREVATLTGRSVTAVRAWEAGRAVPGRDSRVRLERAYGLEPGALVTAYPSG
jgi:transcriptional regulator with XRE-family HTH domain